MHSPQIKFLLDTDIVSLGSVHPTIWLFSGVEFSKQSVNQLKPFPKNGIFRSDFEHF